MNILQAIVGILANLASQAANVFSAENMRSAGQLMGGIGSMGRFLPQRPNVVATPRIEPRPLYKMTEEQRMIADRLMYQLLGRPYNG